MYRVISISSDEDSSTDVERPRKKPKLDTNDGVIVLDDDEQNGNPKTKVIDKQSTSTTNSAIQESISLDSEDDGASTSKVENEEAPKNGKETSDSEAESENEPEHDTIKLFENCEDMQKFVDLCYSHIRSEHVRDIFKSKLAAFKKMFDKVGDEFIQSERFKNEINSKIVISQESPYLAIQSFNELFLFLKLQLPRYDKDEKNNEIVIKKLQHTLKKISKRIKALEDAEIDWDEDSESSFIKQARYKERAVQIHNKLCKYMNVDPHYNQLLHNRLDFSGSDIPEFNKAINRKYKNNSVFPTYYDLEKCLKKCVEQNNLQMTDVQFQLEAKQCFEKLGNLLQHRRKLDLMTIHSQYLVTNVDPAADNPQLNSVLVESYKSGQSKIDEICKKYTQLQESGKEVKLSSESDVTETSESENETDKP